MMHRRAAALLLLLSGLLLGSGETLSRRLLEDLERKDPEAAQEA
jgi:hypothetical protein